MNMTSHIQKADTPIVVGAISQHKWLCIKILALVAVTASTPLIAAFADNVGYLLIDEAIYHWMTKNFENNRTLSIWNGYDEFPSLELAHPFTPIHFGRLVPQYPYLFPVLAAVFYHFLGPIGVSLTNSIAFMGVIVCCFVIARRLFRDINLAINSCFILIFATFLWEYSQASWPHMTSIFFMLSAFYFFLYGYQSPNRRTALLASLAAGIIAGVGAGVRLDVALILPCMLLPFFFSWPSRLWEALMICIGSIPGFLLLGFTNYVKFGLWNPFVYETRDKAFDVAFPYEITVAGSCVILGIWAVPRIMAITKIDNPRLKYGVLAVLSAIVICVGSAVIFGSTKYAGSIKATIGRSYQFLVDMRTVSPDSEWPAMKRSNGGGVIYIGAQKKALLQSMPYLSILLVPILEIIRRRKNFSSLAMLFLIPLTFFGFFSGRELQHGGLCLNYRFLLPALPFLAILTAYALGQMQERWGPSFNIVGYCAVGSLIALVSFSLMCAMFVSIDDLEIPLLAAPLALAGLLLLSLALSEFSVSRIAKYAAKCSWILITLALTWAGLVAFLYDYPAHQAQRKKNGEIASMALRFVVPDSILFSFPFRDPFMGLIEGDRVRIALPELDDFKDFPELVAFHLKAGRRIFAVFPIQDWQRLRKQGILAPYEVRSLWTGPIAFLGNIWQDCNPPFAMLGEIRRDSK